MLTDRLESCGLLPDYCDDQLFSVSFSWHPFTAEDPLVSKLFNDKFLKSVLMKQQTHLHLGSPEG